MDRHECVGKILDSEDADYAKNARWKKEEKKKRKIPFPHLIRLTRRHAAKRDEKSVWGKMDHPFKWSTLSSHVQKTLKREPAGKMDFFYELIATPQISALKIPTR